jgi:spore coat protein U-like protein
MRRVLISLAIVAGLVAAMPASGEAQAGSCSVSATGVAFGNYDVFNATALDSSGSITYQCTTVRLLRIELSQGSSGNYALRQMRRGAEVLNYNLYLDAARTSIWGDGSGITDRLQTVVFAGVPRTSTVYGRVLPLQNAVVGLYTDTLVVTVDF